MCIWCTVDWFYLFTLIHSYYIIIICLCLYHYDVLLSLVLFHCFLLFWGCWWWLHCNVSVSPTYFTESMPLTFEFLFFLLKRSSSFHHVWKWVQICAVLSIWATAWKQAIDCILGKSPFLPFMSMYTSFSVAIYISCLCGKK